MNGIRALAGTALGLAFAWATLPLTLAVDRQGMTGSMIFAIVLFAYPIMVIFAGPGALALGWIHSAMLDRFTRRARTRKEIVRVGILLGLPLGVAVFVLSLVVGSRLYGGTSGHGTFRNESFVWLLPSLAGGAGLGWGTTFDLKPGRPEPPRLVRRVRGREGPPFFDNRRVRFVRRTP